MKRICPLSNETVRGKFPAAVKSTIQSGPGTTAFVSVLNTIGAISIDHIHDILNGACNLPISAGTVPNMVKRAVLSVGASLEVIKDNISRLPVAHFDETGVSVNEHLQWAHAA